MVEHRARSLVKQPTRLAPNRVASTLPRQFRQGLADRERVITLTLGRPYSFDAAVSAVIFHNFAVAADSFLTVKARLARALVELTEYLGEDAGEERILIRRKISQSDLAAMAGVARE